MMVDEGAYAGEKELPPRLRGWDGEEIGAFFFLGGSAREGSGLMRRVQFRRRRMGRFRRRRRSSLVRRRSGISDGTCVSSSLRSSLGTRADDCAAFNMLGLIHVVERDDQNIVTIEFHDRSARTGSHFNDTFKFTLGSLGSSPPSLLFNPTNPATQASSAASSLPPPPPSPPPSSTTAHTTRGPLFKNGNTRSQQENQRPSSPSGVWRNRPIRTRLGSQERGRSSSVPIAGSYGSLAGVGCRSMCGIWARRSFRLRRGGIGRWWFGRRGRGANMRCWTRIRLRWCSRGGCRWGRERRFSGLGSPRSRCVFSRPFFFWW